MWIITRRRRNCRAGKIINYSFEFATFWASLYNWDGPRSTDFVLTDCAERNWVTARRWGHCIKNCKKIQDAESYQPKHKQITFGEQNGSKNWLDFTEKLCSKLDLKGIPEPMNCSDYVLSLTDEQSYGRHWIWKGNKIFRNIQQFEKLRREIKPWRALVSEDYRNYCKKENDEKFSLQQFSTLELDRSTLS